MGVGKGGESGGKEEGEETELGEKRGDSASGRRIEEVVRQAESGSGDGNGVGRGVGVEARGHCAWSSLQWKEGWRGWVGWGGGRPCEGVIGRRGKKKEI